MQHAHRQPRQLPGHEARVLLHDRPRQSLDRGLVVVPDAGERKDPEPLLELGVLRKLAIFRRLDPLRRLGVPRKLAIFRRLGVLEGVKLFILRLAAADERADDVGLAPRRDLLPHPLPRDRRLLGPLQPDGRDRGPAGRQLVEDGLVEIAVDRHRRRARNGRRCHHEHVGVPSTLLAAASVPPSPLTTSPRAPSERSSVAPPPSTTGPFSRNGGALLDPEAVLLVDHDNPERAETDVLGQQRVRADENVETSVEKLGLNSRALGASGPVGEQGDRQRAGARDTGRVGNLQPTEKAPSRQIMLLSEHLGGDHESTLVTALYAIEEARERHDGLPQRLRRPEADGASDERRRDRLQPPGSPVAGLR